MLAIGLRESNAIISTILIDASVRLMNLGRTSPSWPAASSSAASHKDNTVPTSCAKHSVQVLSAFAFPSVPIRKRMGNGRRSTYECFDRPISRNNLPGITYFDGYLEM